jgi:hypothetical protein
MFAFSINEMALPTLSSRSISSEAVIQWRQKGKEGGISEPIRPRSRKGFPVRRNGVLEAAPMSHNAPYVNFAPLCAPDGGDRSELVVNY